MLGEHPLDDPPQVGGRGNDLPQARPTHRDDEFAELSVAFDADFDFDCCPDDRRTPDEFCFHVAPLKALAYARTGEISSLWAPIRHEADAAIPR
jgi:hypothetical protein